jgi:hypothetical protein
MEEPVKRFLFGAAVTLACVIPATSASAHGPGGPVITSSAATFTVPATSPAGSLWVLKLWSGGTLVGSAAGTSGQLTVPITATSTCKFQADASVVSPKGHITRYAGTRKGIPNCGGGGSNG